MRATLLLAALCSSRSSFASPSGITSVATSTNGDACRTQPIQAMARRRPRRSVSDRYNVAVGFDVDADEGPKTYTPVPAPTADQIKAGESAFARSKDLIAAGDKASARQIVNVLGRWKTRTEWSEAGIGRKRLIDDYRAGDFFDEDLEKLATDFNKPMEYYIARRPQFMDFCERYGLVARWVHRENCGSLPFPDDEEGRALAASFGATVEELNAELAKAD